MAARPRQRPKNLNLFTIRLPLPALVSIMHRISGAFLFLLLPVLLWSVQQSLTNPDTYAAIHQWLASPFAKLLYWLIAWAYLHHALAGTRHLIMDAHYGINLKFARASSYGVLAISGLTTLFLVYLTW